MLSLFLRSNISESNPPPKKNIPHYYKVNSSIFNHPDFIQNFEKTWEKLLQESDSYTSISIWWENFAKPEITKFLKNFSIKVSKGRKTKKRFLQEMLGIYLHKQNWEEIARTKSELECMINDDSQGILVRGREMSSLPTEILSSYHVNRIMKMGSNSTNKLVINDAKVSDSAIIEQHITDFFTALLNGYHRSAKNISTPIDTGHPFEPDMAEFETFVRDLPGLSAVKSASLETDFTMAELEKVIKQAQTNRSPGKDGLSYEFYKTTFRILGPTLLEIFNDQFKNGSLIQSNREGVTRLINKVSPSIPNVHQLRPITLLCTDYKLLSKLLANRLIRAMPDIITSSQLAVGNQNIHFGNLNILSTIEQVKIKQIPSFLVSYDIFHAFDKTHLEFLFAIMKKMNFGNTFIEFIRAAHTNISTQFILPEKLSSIVKITNSLRQGDPLAMLLFCIVIEPLLLFIQRNVDGVFVSGIAEKTCAFADDLNLLSTSIQDIKLVEKAFIAYEQLTGMVLNKSKTQIMGLGGWQGREDWPISYLKPAPFLKIFGINFYPNLTETIESTWQMIYAKFKNTILNWKNRIFNNIKSRVFILNCFALSKAWYTAQILPPPPYIIKSIDRLSREFIFHNMLEKIPFSETYLPYNKGGLKVPNFSIKVKALQISQLGRFLKIKTSNSNRHLRYWLQISLPQFFEHRIAPRCQTSISYFIHLKKLILQATSEKLISPQNPTQSKCKTIYTKLLQVENRNSEQTEPKVTTKYPELNWDRVWKRLGAKIVPRKFFDTYFRLLHDILQNQNRLFRMGLTQNENCPLCKTPENNIHKFVICPQVKPAWALLRFILNVMSETIFSRLPDSELLFLNFPKSPYEDDILFILFNYVNFIELSKKSQRLH